MLLLLLAAFIPACGRNDLDQSTPQGVLHSAKLAIEQGRAERLSDLIWAENDQMRGVLDELGQVLGRLDALARVVRQKFPKEIDDLHASAKSSGAAKAGSIFARASSGLRGAGVGPPSKATQNVMAEVAKSFIADPYSFLTSESEKLTTMALSADRVAVLYDGKPLIPVIGLTMQRHDDRWYVVLPTTFPGRKGVVSILPKNDEGWEIVGSLFDVFDNVLADTTREIEEGRADSLEEVARLLGEKAFLPAAMVVFAYGKVMEGK